MQHKNSEIKNNARFILFNLMQIAFLEIRASNSLNAAKKFSDIFHNVPLLLLNSKNAHGDTLILNNVIVKAKTYDLGDYIEKLILKIEEKNGGGI